MPDLFDEFMRELERRRAEAEGRTPATRGDARPRPADRAAGDDDAEDRAGAAGDDDAEDRADDRADPAAGRLDESADRGRGRPGEPAAAADSDEPTPDGPAGAPDAGPIPLRPRRRPVGRGRPPRPPVPPRETRAAGGPDDGAQPPGVRNLLRRAGIVVAIIALLAFLTLAAVGIDLWTDVIWYRSVGFDGVFWTRLGAQLGLFLAGLAIALIVLLGNLALAGRLAPPVDPARPGRLRGWADRLGEAQRSAAGTARMAGPFGPYGAPAPGRPAGGDATFLETGELPDIVPLATWLIAAFAVLLALGVAGAVSGSWETLLLWVHRVPFSPNGPVTDPVFNRDIGFFLFDLPFFRIVQSLVNGLLLASLVIVGARYLLAATRGGEVFVTRVRVHLAVLGGLYLLSVAFGYQLDKFELVYSQQGVATGVAYADANARFLAYDVLTVLSGVAGALLVGGAFTRWLWPLGLIVIVWFAASVILGRLYPEAVQRFSVDPNTYAQEEPYIANNIAMTRLAFGLDGWATKPYRGDQPLTQGAISSEADTFTNARLWDYRPLQTTLAQLQVVRQYYDFVDVDTDRYTVDGKLRQVMLSGRELAIQKNPSARGWVNERVIYTHGIGLAMVPVNEVTPEGQPRLWVRDLPPVSTQGAPTVSEPRIYFGESDSHYVVVGARQAEFDYPRDSAGGSADQRNTWTAKTGISLDTTLSRLLFALRFRDLDLLISDQVTADSQLLFHRTLKERLGLIAPFLRFDKDPYLVVDGSGRLVFVQDAYTVSDRFPHATPFSPSDLGAGTGLAGSPINYLRNSVKVTMDAYDGRLRFYVSDPSDPLIRAWGGVFPDLFTPLSQLPADLVAHLRVPEEQFNVQTRMYGKYHVTQPLTFFQNADLWTIPDAQSNDQTLASEAYYVVMRMPGESAAEFLLLQPMIAANRPNMIAWVAARSDPPNYGGVRVFQFPADTTIFGPAQIEARIDQDPTISGQVTLWNQSGSRVIRGNLIVIPVGESLIYLQPVYLQSTSAAFPEFQKIVVASPSTVVWGDSLAEGLELLLRTQGGPTPSPTPGPSPSGGPSPSPGGTATPAPSATPAVGLPGDVPGLIAYANQHFEAAQAALRNGDFATYGDEIAKVKVALQRLGQLSASPALSPSPSAGASTAP